MIVAKTRQSMLITGLVTYAPVTMPFTCVEIQNGHSSESPLYSETRCSWIGPTNAV